MRVGVTKIGNDLIGVAGVHFVAMKLSLRGLVALPTVRNTPEMDLLVSTPDGRGEAALQVKSSLKRVDFWPTSRAEKCLCGPRSFYVFLRYVAEEDTFEAFLETGDAVAAQVKANADAYVRYGRKEFNCWRLPKTPKALQRLRGQWADWWPPMQ